MHFRVLLPGLLAAAAWLSGCVREEPVTPTLPQGPRGSSAAQAEVVPGQYIVVFRDDVRDPVGLAFQLAAAHGLSIRHTYEHALKGFSAEVPEAALEALRQHPMVDFVEPNKRVYALEGPSIPIWGLTLTAAPLAAPPRINAPSNLDAVAVSSSQINLTWTDNSGNEDGFEIRRSTTGPSGTFTKIAEVGANVTNYSDTGLNAGTQYCYKVRAFRATPRGANFSQFSNTDCDTTPGRPAAPSNANATPANSSTVDVTWTDNSGNEDGFRVERSTDGGATWVTAGTTGPNVTSFTNGGRTSEAQVCYRVIAFNANGDSSPSNTDCTTPPAGPTNLVATKVDHQAIDLTWTDNSGVEDGYEVQRSTAGEGGPFSVIANLAANTTSYRDSGLNSNTTYWYRVRAKKDGGFSDFSNVASATTDPAPPGACQDVGGHDDLTDLWNIQKVKAPQNCEWKSKTAITVEIYIIDTGIDLNPGHPDLNVVNDVNFISDRPQGVEGQGHGKDCNGHGTHVSGTAAAKDGNGGVVGVAPGAPLIAVRVLDCNGSGTVDDVIEGVDFVTGKRNANPSQPMVANMSLGGSPSESLDQAVRNSSNRGVVYAIAAGNGIFGFCLIPGDAQNVSPARVGDDNIQPDGTSSGDTKRVNGVITTTSSNRSDQDVNCNFGNPVTVAAPGVNIKSTDLNGGFSTKSGTSMASAHSAGGAALYLHDHRNATPTEVEQVIVDNLDPWTTNDLPNADGRLDVEPL